MSMETGRQAAETHYYCREIAKERDQLRLEYITSVGETQAALEQRDTYRAMCVELLETTMKLRFISGRTTTAIDESITKAEKVLGGKNGTSN